MTKREEIIYCLQELLNKLTDEQLECVKQLINEMLENKRICNKNRKEIIKDFLVAGTPVYFMLAMFLHWLGIGY